MSDFPGYDGSSSPDDFFRQCSRLAKLGQIDDDRLCVIVAAKCRGRALAVVNGIEDCGDKLTLSTIKEQLCAHFGDAERSVEQAAQNLSSLVKGSLSAQDYGLKVKQLVRRACPEFFSEEGQVKKTCVPSYSAALYRHFLIGLTIDEKRLLSRLKATTFDECLTELTREEGLQSAEVSSAATVRRVRWSSLDSLGHEPERGRWSASLDRRGRWSSPARGAPPSGDRRRAGTSERDRGPTEWDRRGRWSSPAGGSPPTGDRRRAGTMERDRGPTEWDHRGRWSSPAAGAGRAAERGRSASPRDGRRWTPAAAGGRSRTSPHRDRRPTAGRAAPSATRDSDTESSDGEPARPGRPRSRTRDRTPDRRAGARGAAPGPDSRNEGRRSGTVRCWSCGGMGHLKRQCPNEYAGRHTRWD